MLDALLLNLVLFQCRVRVVVRLITETSSIIIQICCVCAIIEIFILSAYLVNFIKINCNMFPLSHRLKCVCVCVCVCVCSDGVCDECSA